MKTKTSIALLAAGIVSLLALGTPNLADANARNRQKKLDKAARHELNKDAAELQRDRADLRNLYRSGASRSDIYNKKAEIRDDLREIFQDRRQRGYGDYRRDHGDYSSYGNRSRWSRDDSGWWNWGRNRWNGRNRWGWDYRHD
ncbi:MAG: hypothetical protein ACM3SP_04790 [Chloroflexota bacterium]